ncbi:MAG: ABC transporter substrate-binding protein [Promethearchaeota archaeon]
MRKVKRSILLIFFTIFASMPFISVIAASENLNTSQATTKSFVCGITFGTGDWDPPIYISTPTNYYFWGCLEGFVWTDLENIAHPLLATNWTIYPRPDEGGHAGGGKAIAFSLRQGVTFHDGSEWNASVAKWNIERDITISGNLTGKGDFQNRDLYWFDAAQWDNDFTPHWNLSWYKKDLFGLGTEIPIINKTEIINPYLINITVNTWTAGVEGFAAAYYQMISMESYKDWFGEPIYGLGENPNFPQNNPAVFPGHLIGTGPYKFDYLDESVTSTGHLIKNDDYWNATALEARGLYTITDVYVRHYADTESRTTAALTGEIDYISDLMQIAITDHDAIMADPLFDYVPVSLDTSIIDITFKCQEGLNVPCVGLTGDMAWANGLTPKQIFPVISGGIPLPDGVDRTVRRALSYSFDYDTYFNVVQEGWGNLSQSCLGIESVYYNPSIPESYHDVTKAREILLSDPYYATICADRRLGLSNTTAEWNAVAISNPIDSHNMLYNTGDESPVFMKAALNDIGFGFVGVPVADLWKDYVAKGAAVLFDMFPFVWPGSRTDPWGLLNAFYGSKNRVIPYYGYNFCFMANDSIDQLFTDLYFTTNQQPLYNQLADQIQNYHTPWLYISQYQLGFAHNIGWSFTKLMPERIGFSGLPYYAWIKGDRLTVSEPPISGYPMPLVIITTIVAACSAIYVTMRKKLSD